MIRRHPDPSPAGLPALPPKEEPRPSPSLFRNFDGFVFNVYLPHIRARKRSWIVDDRIARRYLSPAFGDRKLTSIRSHEVEDWLLSLAARGLAPATCNRILAVFKAVCTVAVMRDALPTGRSPCLGVSFLKVREHRERCLTRDDAWRLMRVLEQSARPEALALRLLLLTGARKSEILKARWEQVRMDLRLLIVPLSKSGKPRPIALSDAALAVLKAIPRTDSPWLFPGYSRDKPLSDLYLFWKEIRDALGLADVRIHDLRHTFASLLVNAGHSLYEVQKLLGHSDPRTTMRYAHLGRDSLVAAAQAVGGWLNQADRPASENQPHASADPAEAGFWPDQAAWADQTGRGRYT